MEKTDTGIGQKALRLYTVRLDGMSFFCHHGCREDEKLKGNTFVVDFEGDYYSSCGGTDDLEDTLNYGPLYDVIAAQMDVRSNLLEHIASRILDAVNDSIPGFVRTKVTVSKKNPPVKGPCEWSRITLEWKKNA